MTPVTLDTTLPLAEVRELPAGDRVTGFYLATRVELKPKRTGGHYLELTLQDRSGKITAKKWDDFEDVAASLKGGEAVKVEGAADRYQGQFSLIISRIRAATAEEVPDARVLLPRSPLEREQALEQLRSLLDSIQHPHLSRLLHALFDDAEFLEAFLESPAGKQWHHADIGGLAEHSLTLARVADGIAGFYGAINRDLLVTGALLHDAGKVVELTRDATIDYSVDGRLLGHIYLGSALVEARMAALEDFPEEVRRQVLHLILAHQGDGTMGSPVKPMTLEALVLHYLDELDSKIEAFRRKRASTPAGQEFSDWVRLMERYFYFKGIDRDGQTEEA